jgi:ABC-2 type transport system permease protein
VKLFSVIRKSFKEQIRSFWVFILTISMAPGFIFIYYLILESEKPNFELLILNQDKGLFIFEQSINYADLLLDEMEKIDTDSIGIPLSYSVAESRDEALTTLKNKKADALIVIPENFTVQIIQLMSKQNKSNLEIELVGDLTDFDYMITAVFTNEIISEYLYASAGTERLFQIKETPLGKSGSVNEFDLVVPGLLILALIMLMFSATISIIIEVEHKTILRLKLSKLGALNYLTGVSIVQIFVGLISIFLTLAVAFALGFTHTGSLGIFILIAVLTSISIIAFSLILAGITKSANEVLTFGNFPLLLFMFFSGAAFPISGKTLFTFMGYSFTIQGLMSPTHAIAALKKVMIYDMSFLDIIPEVLILLLITILYFVLGVWIFNKRHMKVV